MIQWMMIMDTSFTPSKKPTRARFLSGFSIEAAAPNRIVKTISGSMSPRAAASIGLSGIMSRKSWTIPGASSASWMLPAASPP